MSGKLSAFAGDKGRRLSQAMQEQLHPLLNDKGIVAARVVFLYEADGQMLGGAIDLQLHPGAGEFLEALLRQRLAGQLQPVHQVRRVHQQHKKS